MKQPLGNNGPHCVFVGEQDEGQWQAARVEFEKWEVGQGWVDPYENGPLGRGVETKNVFIANCTASNGTIDYFKWDPESDDPALKEPTISFDIVDADPHNYAWVLYYRQSAGSETWTDGEYWAAQGTEVGSAGGTTHVDVDLSALTVPGHLDPDVHPWGTYTYDVLVMEYEGATPPTHPDNAMDHNYLKTPYCLWVPEETPEETPRAGHRWWERILEDGSSEIRAEYWLNDQCHADAAELAMIPVDPGLSERGAVPGPVAPGVMHEGEDEDDDEVPDGIPVYRFADDDPGGTWRVLWTGVDACGPHWACRRTHDCQRMLVANDGAVEPGASTMVFSWGYYETKPYCTADTKYHTAVIHGTTYSQTELRVPIYDHPLGLHIPFARSALSDTAGAVCISQAAGKYKAGPTGWSTVDGTWKVASNALKRNTSLFTFIGHATPPGTQGHLAFWHGGEWQCLRGSEGEAAPSGVHYINFDDCWGHLRVPPLEERLKDLRFALLLGCSLAGTEQYSIAKELVHEGANAVGGFEGPTYAATSQAFAVYFWALAMGNDTDLLPDEVWQGAGPRPLDVQTAAETALEWVRYAAANTPYKDLVPEDDEFHLYGPPNRKLVLAPAGGW